MLGSIIPKGVEEIAGYTQRWRGHGGTFVPAVGEGHSSLLCTPALGCWRTWERWVLWSERQADGEQG